MTSIVVEQWIPAPPATVYRYLTDSDKWAMWQGVSARHDARVGGLFSMSMADGANARGQFTDLVPGERVVFTWGWVDRPGIPPGSTTVEIALSPHRDGTLLVLTHNSLPDEEATMHRMGWDHYLPRLALAAAGQPPGPDLGPG